MRRLEGLDSSFHHAEKMHMFFFNCLTRKADFSEAPSAHDGGFSTHTASRCRPVAHRDKSNHDSI